MTLDNANTDNFLEDYSGWIFGTHVETATARDEGNVERLLRCLVGHPVCKKVVGCKWNFSGLASKPKGSVLVMTDCRLPL